MKSPKRAQKEGNWEEALRLYKERYTDALKEGDSYISQLYLDEYIQTLFELASANAKLKEEQLRSEIEKQLGQEYAEQSSQFYDDLEICMAKRYPRKQDKSELIPDEGQD